MIDFSYSSLVRDGVRSAARSAAAEGIPVPPVEGKLLRPLIAHAFVPDSDRRNVTERFWSGALAIQAVHEASLLHDDILDGAETRRGEQTLSSSAGVGPALVMGDQLLTAAYRLAKRTGSAEFLDRFIDAVERTVAGEIAQGKSTGKLLDWDQYHDIVDGKSGALFGVAAALWPCMSGADDIDAVTEVGVRIGRAYQMVDDVLDYCSTRDTGKPPLQDLRQGKWTWPLAFSPNPDLNGASQAVLRSLFNAGAAPVSPMRLAVQYFEQSVDGLLAETARLNTETTVLEELLRGWVHTVHSAVSEEESLRVHSPAKATAALPPRHQDLMAEAVVRRLAAAQGDDASDRAVFKRNARSFSFAARFFEGPVREDVAALYAYCRFTDDLVDDPANGVEPAFRDSALEFWTESSMRAYAGRHTGMPFLDRVMGMLRDRDVPFQYVNDLLEGCRMDLRPVAYETMDELWTYTYRVAGALGCLMTRMFGVDDPVVLGRAQALGDAMQLTNILRDVGEDLDRGRIYVPREILDEYGITTQELVEMRAGVLPIDERWSTLVEHLIGQAEERYEMAFEALTALPSRVRPAVAVAARVYAGIHDEIRANQYDNLTKRAHTSRLTKLRLATRALSDLRRLDPFPPTPRRVTPPQQHWGTGAVVRT